MTQTLEMTTDTGPAPVLSTTPLQAVARELERATPHEILRWAATRFGDRCTFATGFGPEGCVLIDVIGRHQLPIDVFTLDTGLLFAETHRLWTELQSRYGIAIRGVRPEQTVEQQATAHGDELWARAPDQCCRLRKVFPLRAELARVDAWITAIRRDQTAERARAAVVEQDEKFNIVKINPLVGWTKQDVWSYLHTHDVPFNPLHDRGYPSIGCQPCTTPVRSGEDERSGRWRGSAKTECGLHTIDRRESAVVG